MPAPILPEAPARLSTITCWPRLAESRTARMRAMLSTLPPAGHGTIRRMGLPGQAATGSACTSPPARATAAVRTMRRRKADMVGSSGAPLRHQRLPLRPRGEQVAFLDVAVAANVLRDGGDVARQRKVGAGQPGQDFVD